ncbi:hypothetical protein SAE01_02200 [Segetibacter aerophilus]|uniref:Uncharacterized protein n=1 Tax=Segetibacter aerophilus TaxID=670293 RepID=A0A512B6Z0_9BACT|nr:hypothetical protein SAE01_02200 [Segetibacter aerophilus]
MFSSLKSLQAKFDYTKKALKKEGTLLMFFTRSDSYKIKTIINFKQKDKAFLWTKTTLLGGQQKKKFGNR